MDGVHLKSVVEWRGLRQKLQGHRRTVSEVNCKLPFLPEIWQHRDFLSLWLLRDVFALARLAEMSRAHPRGGPLQDKQLQDCDERIPKGDGHHHISSCK